MYREVLGEVWKKGRLKSDIPSPIRHRVVPIYKSLREKGMGHRSALSRAFAIATAAAQKTGEVKRGTRKSTRRGAGRSAARVSRRGAVPRDREYERVVSGDIKETASRGIFNQSVVKRNGLGRRRGHDGTITPKPTANWLFHGAIPKIKKPRRLRRKRYRPGLYDKMGTVFEQMDNAERIVRGD